MTGHKTTSVFRRYNIVDFQDQVAAAAALEALAAEEKDKVKTRYCDLPKVVNS